MTKSVRGARLGASVGVRAKSGHSGFGQTWQDELEASGMTLMDGRERRKHGQSIRSVTTGSVAAARRAGTTQARRATITRLAVAAAYDAISVVVMP
jgi:hypothetical protein